MRQNVRMTHNRDGRREDYETYNYEHRDQKRWLVEGSGDPCIAKQRHHQCDDGQDQRPFAPPWFAKLAPSLAHDKPLRLAALLNSFG